MDVTVTRVARDEFTVVTGTALGPHDLGWLRDAARRTVPAQTSGSPT